MTWRVLCCPTKQVHEQSLQKLCSSAATCTSKGTANSTCGSRRATDSISTHPLCKILAYLGIWFAFTLPLDLAALQPYFPDYSHATAMDIARGQGPPVTPIFPSQPVSTHFQRGKFKMKEKVVFGSPSALRNALGSANWRAVAAAFGLAQRSRSDILFTP